jgi:hypothetical protein
MQREEQSRLECGLYRSETTGMPAQIGHVPSE